jgi:hypothetical protein
MSEDHAAAAPLPDASPGTPSEAVMPHLLAAVEALAAALESIGANIPAAHSSGVHWRSAVEHLKNARAALG